MAPIRITWSWPIQSTRAKENDQGADLFPAPEANFDRLDLERVEIERHRVTAQIHPPFRVTKQIRVLRDKNPLAEPQGASLHRVARRFVKPKQHRAMFARLNRAEY